MMTVLCVCVLFGDCRIDVRVSQNLVKARIMGSRNPISHTRETELQGDEVVCPGSLSEETNPSYVRTQFS